MTIVTPSQKLQYELANVARLFFPAEEMHWVTEMPADGCDQTVVTATWDTVDNRILLEVKLTMPNGHQQQAEQLFLSSQEVNLPIELGKLLYKLLCDLTGREIDWGVLTGIRPVKLARRQRLLGRSPQDIEQHFTEHYLTNRQKAALCRLTDEVQSEIVASGLPRGYSLYISIPFCPSRCSYCSFVSHSTEKSRRMIPDYLDKLCLEIADTARIAKEKGLVLQSIYMGGGTPTILTSEQLRQVLSATTGSFDLTGCCEFTIEAGRPDTITPEKLEVMRSFGVDRISVNCQTLNNRVLEAVGRKHTAEDFFQAFNLVKSYDFTSVNVDLIAGLPHDTLESFKNSVNRVIDLAPENITVHALTVKRAARLAGSKQAILGDDSWEQGETSAMVSFSQQRLGESGYLPYYLYRQKGTIDSLENVGFCLPGFQCRYNIFIMDETHTILSVGGGGVTKLVMSGSESAEENVRIERIFNYKYPYEYSQRFDTMLEKKQKILGFPL